MRLLLIEDDTDVAANIWEFFEGRADLAGLSPGYQELEVVGRELHVLVTDVGDVRNILTYDGTPLETIDSREETGVAKRTLASRACIVRT